VKFLETGAHQFGGSKAVEKNQRPRYGTAVATIRVLALDRDRETDPSLVSISRFAQIIPPVAISGTGTFILQTGRQQ
jgi:hypothetical protein